MVVEEIGVVLLDGSNWVGGIGHCLVVTEARNSRLRPYTDINGEKPLRTRRPILLTFHYQFLKNDRSNIAKFWNTDRKCNFEGRFRWRNFEKNAFESSFFLRFGRFFSVVSTQTVYVLLRNVAYASRS